MMHRLITIIGILIVLAGAIRFAHADDVCERERNRWSESFEALKKAVDDYRNIKDESVAPRIDEIMAKNSRANMAAVIQSVLKNRADRLTEAGGLCQDAVTREKSAYEIWRRCGGTDRQRKNAPPQDAHATVGRDRDRLVAGLQDLLLDEGYVQYKGQAAVPINETGQAARDQRETYQDYRWRGYGGQQPAGSWPGYQGYYR
jgi:hypothetical protein